MILEFKKELNINKMSCNYCFSDLIENKCFFCEIECKTCNQIQCNCENVLVNQCCSKPYMIEIESFITCTNCGKMKNSMMLTNDWDTSMVVVPHHEFDNGIQNTFIRETKPSRGKKLQIIQYQSTQNNARQRYDNGIKDMVQYFEKINLNSKSQVVTKAKTYWKLIIDEKISKKGVGRLGIMANCLYYSFLDNNVFRTIEEVCKIFNITTKDFKKSEKLIRHLLYDKKQVGLNVMNSKTYECNFSRMANEFDLPFIYVRKMNQCLEKNFANIQNQSVELTNKFIFIFIVVYQVVKYSKDETKELEVFWCDKLNIKRTQFVKFKKQLINL